jgi:phosphoribosylformimino-5-aminoimidazole carboxamide ribotide isomerase
VFFRDDMTPILAGSAILTAVFEVIPAVDMQKGRAVRLAQGDPERETVYFESPVEAARHWTMLGAGWLHLVDLDAALGRGDNRTLIAEIATEVAETPCKLELGGGIRDLQAARDALEHVERVVLGTAAIHSPELVDELLEAYGPERVVVSIDARDGQVAVKGWQEASTLSAPELARRVSEQGVKQVIYTDISRDGTLQGVNPEPLEAMRQAFGHTLLAGGGVAGEADLDLYEQLGLDGAIVGRALYEGRIRYPRTA